MTCITDRLFVMLGATSRLIVQFCLISISSLQSKGEHAKGYALFDSFWAKPLIARSMEHRMLTR